MRAALIVAALASTAGGLVTHGLYFLTSTAWGFDDHDNLLLAVALFVVYVPAALAAGPLARRIGARAALLGANALMIGAAAALLTRPPVAVLLVAAPAYNAAAGLMWPLIEAYVAGGRHGAPLQRAIGAFNLTWASTLAPALWIVALAGDRVEIGFAALLVLHLVALPALLRLPADPPPADPEAAAPHVGAHYPFLLRAARALLPVSYLLLDTLAPLLPGVWARAGVAAGPAAALSSTWMLARLVVFAAMYRVAGWRGRWAVLGVGAALFVAGFAAALSGAAPAVVLAGLVAFGVGQGMVYYAALYYGMAVGHGQVESGGWHEAVIGLGYLGGPLLALGGLWVGVPPVHAVGAVASAGVAASLLPWWRARRLAPSGL